MINEIEIGNRKLQQKSKGGALFTVPQVWLKMYHLNAGDLVGVVIGERGELVLKKVNRK
ncbi:MAG: hypothetical protein QXU18_02365 [Thermoplasmatales archaeon]